MTNKELADLLLPGVSSDTDYYEKKYPERNVDKNAVVTPDKVNLKWFEKYFNDDIRIKTIRSLAKTYVNEFLMKSESIMTTVYSQSDFILWQSALRRSLQENHVLKYKD